MYIGYIVFTRFMLEHMLLSSIFSFLVDTVAREH